MDRLADITVIVATHNRVESLKPLLMGLAKQASPSVITEIVVADNGSTDCTQQFLKEWSSDLKLINVCLSAAGKAAALNAALEAAQGELIVFTDDDIEPSCSWLDRFWQMSLKFPNAYLFAGPIRPVWPDPTPEWIKLHELSNILYAQYQPSNRCCWLPAASTPYGPNFAVRRKAIGTVRYRLDLGPSQTNGALSYDDVEFISEINNRHSAFVAGKGMVFHPDAIVFHQVRPEQLGFEWMYERFFNIGRSVVARNRRFLPYVYPSLLIKRDALVDNSQKLRVAAELNYYLGELTQLQILGDEGSVEDVFARLVHSSYLHEHSLLSRSAKLFLDLLFAH
jgi:glycosyltransferase involved in cell wall biosynthesis